MQLKSFFKVIGTVGEPINPSAWRWLYNVVGEKRCAVVDTYWQTETVYHCFWRFLVKFTKKRFHKLELMLLE